MGRDLGSPIGGTQRAQRGGFFTHRNVLYSPPAAARPSISQMTYRENSNLANTLQKVEEAERKFTADPLLKLEENLNIEQMLMSNGKDIKYLSSKISKVMSDSEVTINPKIEKSLSIKPQSMIYCKVPVYN